MGPLWTAYETVLSRRVGASSAGTTAETAGEWKWAAQIAHEMSAMPELDAETCC